MKEPVYDAVDENFKKQAISELHKRLKNGEDIHDILEMGPEHDFYIEKIKDGLVPLSWALYSRIMGCASEDSPD